MTALLAYLGFELTRLARSRRYVLMTLGFPVVFDLVLISTTAHGGATVVAGTSWARYLMVSMAVFGAMSASFGAGGPRLAAERASGWVRQLRATPLPPWSYVAVKLVAGMALVLPVVAAVGLTSALANHVHLGPGAWAEILAVMWLGALPFAALGVLLGFVVRSDVAYPATIATMFGLAYLGGLFQPVSAMPGGLRALARVLPTYHLGALGWHLAAGRPFDFVHVIVLGAYTAGFAGLLAWRYRQDEARPLG